jgi:diaminohydroxyphosphoribosylaminopyrimidine deaminase/5-amino-6-(5-phosphoribosylamino)uracil reductase
MSARSRDPARDIAFMRSAIALARRGLGSTAPNPSVAALVVDERGAVPLMLGRGRTAKGGRPHAEALAIMSAGEAARGATMYVVLEPCAQRSQRVFGPSCTEMILEAGIARVVIGAPDPSPFAGGEGARRLREAGVEVVTGVCEAEARAINAGHCLRVSANRPFVTLKLAQTADGFAATTDRRALAITGEETRAFVHATRARHDAILTGISTVLADDPRLDVRLPGMSGLSPLRVVLDTQGRMPASARMLALAHGQTLVLSAKPLILAVNAQNQSVNERNHNRINAAQDVEITAVPQGEDGHLDLQAALGALAARGITRLMVEAGPTLADAFARAGLIDEAMLFTGPERVGEGLPAIRSGLAQWLALAERRETRMIGRDRCEIFGRMR